MTTLPLWAFDSKRKYIVDKPREVPALKTIQVWNSVRARALNINEVHVQNGIRKLVSHQRPRLAEKTYNKMIRKSRDNPPRIVVFHFQDPDSDNLRVVDKIRKPGIIFIRNGLVSALENASGGLDTHLRFILPSVFFHELAHRLTCQVFGRRLSEPHMMYEDYFGANVGVIRDGVVAEAGYMFESHLWGGVLSWGGTNQARPRGRTTRVHDAYPNEWTSIQFLMLRRGPYSDSRRFIIYDAAFASRMTGIAQISTTSTSYTSILSFSRSITLEL